MNRKSILNKLRDQFLAEQRVSMRKWRAALIKVAATMKKGTKTRRLTAAEHARAMDLLRKERP